MEKISINPVVDADPPSVKIEEMRIWCIGEINTFLNHSRDERHYITFLLAIYTGMRRGEILGMKWSDIDFSQKVIHVQRSLTFQIRVIRAGKVTPIRFHDIRHTHASILISEGVDIVKVSARLGHANPKITLEIYAHLMSNKHNDVADIFHNALNDPETQC